MKNSFKTLGIIVLVVTMVPIFGLVLIGCNNNLPTDIQGTVWSNGKETIEFGKNKVKLNDDWYSVKKITKGNQPTNFMFTWVTFADRYVTLQEWTSGELRLTRLYYDGARADNFISGFMTPAEIEAKKIEDERIAKEITGVWEGSYYFDGYYAFKADMTFDIQSHVSDNGRYPVLLNFEVTYIHNSAFSFGAPFPVNTKGSCILDMTYNKDGKHLLEFGRWTMQPKGFERLSFSGTIQDNVFSGNSSGYIKPVPIRGEFKVVRKNY